MDMTYPVTLDKVPAGPDLEAILRDIEAADKDEWIAFRAEAPYEDAPEDVHYRAALHAPMTWESYAYSGLLWQYDPLAAIRASGAVDRALERMRPVEAQDCPQCEGTAYNEAPYCLDCAEDLDASYSADNLAELDGNQLVAM